MKALVPGLLLLGLWGPAAARTPAAALQGTLVRTVRQYNQQLKRGQPAMDLGLVFRMVGRTLERTGGDQLAAQRMAVRAARWSARRSHPRKESRRLSPQVVRALRMACQLHRNQVRKGTSIPYISHLLGVAGIVMHSGGSEREVIAALLHDAAEDQGGARTLRLIRRRFGRQVARTVEEVTEPRGDWRWRKQHTIDCIRTGRMTPSGLRVKLADALHNSGTMTKGARQQGDAFWSVFSGKRAGSLWYLDEMLAGFRPAAASAPQLRRLTDRLQRQVERLHDVAAGR
jgi:GTP pyrophosphokinase